VVVGTSTSLFEIPHDYDKIDKENLLLRNVHLGEALASRFSRDHSRKVEMPKAPHQTVVLLRRYGVRTIAGSIKECHDSDNVNGALCASSLVQ
jgi:hypothetical protein